MKRARYLGLWLLAVSSAVGQNAGRLPAVKPIPPLGRPAPGFRSSPRPGFDRRSTPFFPVYLGGYDDSSNPDYAPAPNVVVVQQPPAYVVLQGAPSQTTASEIREYTIAPTEPPPDTGEEAAAFAIVLKDGSVHSAAAVTVQDDVLHYVEPDGRHLRVALSAVDREATRRRNRERKLDLQLPATDR